MVGMVLAGLVFPFVVLLDTVLLPFLDVLPISLERDV
jgi:uncharacterized protein YceK